MFYFILFIAFQHTFELEEGKGLSRSFCDLDERLEQLSDRLFSNWYRCFELALASGVMTMLGLVGVD